VAAQHVARAVGWSLGCLVAPMLLGAMFGPRWIAVGVGVALLATAWLLLWLPRAAHAAFQAGRFPLGPIPGGGGTIGAPPFSHTGRGARR